MPSARDICGLDLIERDNLDPEMRQNRRLRSFMQFYAGANRMAQAIGLRPSPQALEMNRSSAEATHARRARRV